jgi:hypothetical protein
MMNYQQDFISGTAYLILLVALGIFYRVLRRIKSSHIEDLSKELENLMHENEILRNKLGLKPTDPIDSETDKFALLNKPEEEK